MICGSLACRLVKTEAAETWTRKGKQIPEGELATRLFLAAFAPSQTAFGFRIVKKNSPKSIRLPLYLVDENRFIHRTVCLVDIARRLHLSAKKLRKLIKKDPEKPLELLQYLHKKEFFFTRLPKIIEQAGKIFALLDQQQENIFVQAILQKPLLMQCIRHFYRQTDPICNVGTQLWKDSIGIYTWRILGFKNRLEDLEITLINASGRKENMLGCGSFGHVDKQWHLNSAAYCAWKRSVVGEYSKQSIDSIEHEYDILRQLHSYPKSKKFALQPLPKALYRIPKSSIDAESYVGYLTDIYDGTVHKLLNYCRVQKRAIFSEDREATFRICEKLAKTVAYAHRIGILHCDIRELNVFYKKDPNGNIHFDLCDWGGAYRSCDRWKRRVYLENADRHFIRRIESLLINKMNRIRKEEDLPQLFAIQERVDIYQLGLLVYQILTDGNDPFPLDKNAPEQEMNRELLQNKGYSKPVIELVENMLHFDMHKRPTAVKIATTFSLFSAKKLPPAKVTIAMAIEEVKFQAPWLPESYDPYAYSPFSTAIRISSAGC
jgi:serine/threonine protein kinase